MSISTLDIINSSLDTLSIPLQDPSLGYYVEEILGLDPVKASLVFTPFGTVDGSQYQASRRDNRNIVLKIGLSPDYITNDVYSLRHGLYSKLMPKSPVMLRFHVNGTIRQTQGYVESLETPIFSQDPEAVISIICQDPDFLATTQTTFNASTSAGATNLTLNYNGSVPTGISFKMTLNRALSEFSFYQSGSDNQLNRIDFAASLLNGDILEISTVPGNKGAWLTRAGNRSSILAGISPESAYFQLLPGENLVRVQCSGAEIPYEIKYTERFGGL